ncbi:MAG: LutB/LldF family L-lactate oxidation iron-sulfur protein [Aromatoleum sp.]|jgi:L-lactate dehydrogenase complex protein LldF|uniref:LutB/LldF family L-lactate oxidation iron-sulfur protein n=1 Tax=Aromatoleum sp. TaxID=2307007 RepID=UPI002894496D|nr:LutB/LldF family L-lactate oxidation iron-sulfur protein [Aromatoleum sp.]MDT3671993.1 LutB/LldF family L-lactate oxidation iron-sulfur protein [Aromatoleum sp.]
MEIRSKEFKERSVFAIHDANLQTALGRARYGFVGKRALQVADLPEFEQLREEAKNLKNHVLDHLDHYLERYEQAVVAAGGHVHWARDGAEAREIILGICKRVDAKTVTKGKSMVSEEIDLNDALQADGIEVVETDLGEYIIQLAHEPPSHIIAPAVHKTKDQVSDLFEAAHGGPRKTAIPELVDEARRVLREKYFRADVGITGGNFLVAETGSSIIVTNEGNGDLTQTLAKVHIVTSGIERVVPTLDDATLFLRLLARSATGQETETYTTISTGPRRADDLDGPEEYHVVLVDNGRSKMLGGRFKDMLRCIRCGACMNHCPVYGAVGGHAYGWVYPGPMGSVLTPLIKGLDAAYDLPNACTLNGRCQSVCPVKIPLPDLLRELRHEQHRQNITPVMQKRALAVWRWVATRPKLYHAMEQVAARALSGIAKRGRIRRLPLASGWTDVRDLPAPTGRTFLELWQGKRGKE